MEDAKRGIKQESALKKGNSSWKPASLNTFTDLDPDFRYRMMRKDPDNLAKKRQEGWETVSDLNSQIEQEDINKIEHGKPLTSVTEGRDWILGRIPNDVAESRDEYINAKTASRTAGLTAHTKKELAKHGAAAHGEITISSRKGTQTL